MGRVAARQSMIAGRPIMRRQKVHRLHPRRINRWQVVPLTTFARITRPISWVRPCPSVAGDPGWPIPLVLLFQQVARGRTR